MAIPFRVAAPPRRFASLPRPRGGRASRQGRHSEVRAIPERLRWLRRTCRAAIVSVTLCATVLSLAQSPFTAPLMERSVADAQRALDRAMAGAVTPDWLLPRLEAALASEDLDAVELYAGLARDHGIPLPTALAEGVAALREAHEGWAALAGDCWTCALDLRDCASLTLMGACALPPELTPLGDLNALRRAGVAAASGEEIDGFEAGLALAGLAATGLVVASGGTSLTVKAGTTLLRVAHRMGTLPPALLRHLRAAMAPVDWAAVPAWLAGRVPLTTVTDTARLSRLSAFAGDLGRIRTNTSTAEALILLRRIDSAEDAARLARVSDVAAGETRRVVEVLGTARAFRLTLRLTEAAIAALLALWALAVQVGTMLAGSLVRRLLR